MVTNARAPAGQRREAARLRRNWAFVSRLRGRAAEERILRLLLAGPRPKWVTDVVPATPEEDARGVDLFVCAGRRRYPLQVKSGLWKALQFVAEHPPNIGVVLAPMELDDATALGRALGVLILLREGRCTRDAMRRAVIGMAELSSIALQSSAAPAQE